MTDRGKMHIPYGKPDSTKREDRDDGPFQIWSYLDLKKGLAFREQGFGEFKLYRTENL